MLFSFRHFTQMLTSTSLPLTGASRRFEVACKGRTPTEPPQVDTYAALTSGSLQLFRASNLVGWRFTRSKASKAGSDRADRADGARAAANYAGNLNTGQRITQDHISNLIMLRERNMAPCCGMLYRSLSQRVQWGMAGSCCAGAEALT